MAALRAWMDRYADFVATKRGMAETLRVITTREDGATARAREGLRAAVGALLAAGVRTGELRAGVPPEDLVAAAERS